MEGLKVHADMFVQYRASLGREYIEGYNIPLENGELPIEVAQDD
ncbi:TPA: hypothetical protein ACTZ5N_003871 [Bacillus cereus]